MQLKKVPAKNTISLKKSSIVTNGVGISAGGWKKFQKLTTGGGDDYSVLKSSQRFMVWRRQYSVQSLVL